MSQSSKSSTSSNDLQAIVSPNNGILSLTQTEIIDVWEQNFEEELYKIMDLIELYNVISLVKTADEDSFYKFFLGH